MARQELAPDLGPRLKPAKAIPVLEDLIMQSEGLRTESWTSSKRQQWVHTAEGALIAALGRSHPNVQAFGTAQGGAYGPYDTEETLLGQANDQLDGMLGVLRSAVEQLGWQLPDSTEVFIPAGSSHDAYVEIRKVIQLVTSEVLIVDSYVDGTLWSLLRNLPATAKVRIMTMQLKGDFALEGRKFAGQQRNTIEIRQTPHYHDRFILVDGSRCWHLGASIKDAGNKAFAMSEMLSPNIRSAVRADIEATWSAATVVPI